MKQLFIFVAVLLANAGPCLAEGNTFESSVEQVHLLELFSTQSCSSCPPAQRWVSGLKDEQMLWKSFVPVVYHVDYWDYLGWKDPYSRQQYTRRQHEYAKKWKSSRVYTPMFVLDGKEWKERTVVALRKLGPAVGVLRVTRTTGLRFDVSFKSVTDRNDRLLVYGALLGNEITTDVKSGENSGRVLKQDFLTLDLRQADAVKRNRTYEASFSFHPAPEAITRQGVSFWVITSDGTLLQAVGGVLSKGE